jgi:hypothetical protein
MQDNVFLQDVWALSVQFRYRFHQPRQVSDSVGWNCKILALNVGLYVSMSPQPVMLFSQHISIIGRRARF